MASLDANTAAAAFSSFKLDTTVGAIDGVPLPGIIDWFGATLGCTGSWICWVDIGGVIQGLETPIHVCLQLIHAIHDCLHEGAIIVGLVSLGREADV